VSALDTLADIVGTAPVRDLDVVYVGRRAPAPRGFRGRPIVVVRVEGQPDEPLEHRRYHSTAFEWNYAGSGPADLARSILWHHLGGPAPILWHHLGGPAPAELANHFLHSVVARLDYDGWELSASGIAAWLGCHLQHGEGRNR
jgi:hypothetical protein